ncbi:peptidoglycan endopeptidase [Novosphingobium sp.]|uniref:peptidoglycan endopeptidase n=1 Tax=Novosphingobium sp. TaxID=1874826 RepID=UPI0025E1CE0D|nr:peptidoglycan endopeptidase [Novosphingobium sp.]
MDLIGVPFRLHGRIPATGLDCVGLVAAAMKQAGYHPVAPQGYSVRALTVKPLLGFAATSGLVEVDERGDIWLAQVHSLQCHLLIAVPGGAVHAHAGLGRVVFMPDPLAWPIVMRWRLSAERN